MIRAVVPKTVAATIARMAKAAGKSQSRVVAEFLIEAEPAIKRLAGMLEVAKSQQSLFPRATVAELEAALDDLSGNATDVMDRLQNALQLPLEGSKGRRRGGASAASGATGRSPRRRSKTPV